MGEPSCAAPIQFFVQQEVSRWNDLLFQAIPRASEKQRDGKPCAQRFRVPV
jgi:hypothetical protein